MRHVEASLGCFDFITGGLISSVANATGKKERALAKVNLARIIHSKVWGVEKVNIEEKCVTNLAPRVEFLFTAPRNSS